MNSTSIFRAVFFMASMIAVSIQLTAQQKYKGAQVDPEILQQREITFIENKGQIIDGNGNRRSDIAYIVNGNSLTAYLGPTTISYVFRSMSEQTQNDSRKGSSATPQSALHTHDHGAENVLVTDYRMDMALIGANPHATIRGEDPVEGYFNYYYEHCPEGITGVRQFKKLIYENVYKNIDIVLNATKKGLKYDFVVRPGGSVSDIRMRYLGARKMNLTGDGALHVETPLGAIAENIPLSYVTNASVQTAKSGAVPASAREVEYRYTLDGNVVGFAGPAISATETLVIDPDVLWSTFYGGNDEEGAHEGGSVAIDEQGNIIIVGHTKSTNLPAGSGHQTTNAGDADIYVAKFNGKGRQIWASYYGSTNNQWAHDVAVNSDGDIFVAGHTGVDIPGDVDNFPVHAEPGHTILQNNYGGMRDGVLIRFDKNGKRIWATYYGGPSYDDIFDVTIDPSGNVVFCGTTKSDIGIANESSWPTTGQNAFVAKCSPTGSFTWGTYYGGSGLDEGWAVEATSNAVILVGETSSADLAIPTGSSVHQNYNAGLKDCFIVKFQNPASAPAPNDSVPRTWATYFGGTDNDIAQSVALDAADNIVIVGQTYSDATAESFKVKPTSGTNPAFQLGLAGQADAFVAKFKESTITSSNHLIWATYLGGDNIDWGYDVALTADDKVWVTGHTASSNFPLSTTPAAVQSYNSGNIDAFVAQLQSNGSKLLWGSYYGGCSEDLGRGIVLDPASGDAVMVGLTSSADFPVTADAFQKSKSTDRDAFIVKFGDPASEWITLYSGSYKLLPEDPKYNSIIKDIAIAGNGDVIAVGSTSEPLFPVSTGAYQGSKSASSDAFILRFDRFGSWIWATYYGGNGSEAGDGVDVDACGRIYVVGSTTSTDITGTFARSPVAGTADQAGGMDAFIAVFNEDGTRQWGSFFGGMGDDDARDVDADDAGNFVIVGHTTSSSLPGLTPSEVHQMTRSGPSDAYISKFTWNTTVSPAHPKVSWTTYFGGSSDEEGNGVRFDANGDVLATGISYSAGQATTGQTTNNGSGDAFVVKLKGNGGSTAIPGNDHRLWSTYLGGSGNDVAHAIDIGPSGEAAVVGHTQSANFPAVIGQPGFQTTLQGGGDGFAVKLNGNTGASLWTTYIGGIGDERMHKVAIDPQGYIVIAGASGSVDITSAAEVFTNSNASPGPGSVSDDAIAIRLNTDGRPVWGKFLGGANGDHGYALGLGCRGAIVIGGGTDNDHLDFPTTAGAHQTTSSGSDFRFECFLATLVPDRNRSVSTYLGGSSVDYAEDVAIDSDGNIVVVGRTSSVNFPISPGITTTLTGSLDAFVSKYDKFGRRRAATYIGGNNDDAGEGIAVDDNNEIVISGWTASTANLVSPSVPAPTWSGLAFNGGTYDGFIAKLNRCLQIVWTRYLGGSADDKAFDIAIGENPAMPGGPRTDIVVAGTTWSDSLPISGPQPPLSLAKNRARIACPTCSDAFVTRISGDGQTLRWSTFYGGWQNEEGFGIAVKKITSGPTFESIVLTGSTTSGAGAGPGMTDDLPVHPFNAPMQATLKGMKDAYMASFTNPTPTTVALEFGTYWGGHLDDVGREITFDNIGNIAFTGETASWDFPVATAFQPTILGQSDAWVTKYNRTFFTPWVLGWSTYYGANGYDDGRGIAADPSGNFIVVGRTSSAAFPVSLDAASQLQSTYGGVMDAFVAKFSALGSPVLPNGWSGYLGGSNSDEATNVAVDPSGNIYTAGWTASKDFRISLYPSQPVNGGLNDAFLIKLDNAGTTILKPVAQSTTDDMTGGCRPDPVINPHPQPIQAITGEVAASLAPNPARRQTTLSLHLSMPAEVSVSIQSMVGEKIADLITNRNFNAGTHELSLPLSSLASGSYLLVVESNGKVVTKQLQLLK